ncbi:ATP-binding protein [Nocardioides coralli]|uniref:ATP-binding protein n=1 Tax=Nocardioides coralli TaxID=2872154 RepID=UPI001CA3970E|nr:ATP-binding protein [Nocardioides coralli]QZY29686.1 ATP-binding protein [Nocardioides coralli]
MTEYDIVPTSLAVKAMRDNGYKNAAYALAELMDNSIQAGATRVDLLCADQETMVDQRTRRRLSSVAVLDNGSGMDFDTLQIALQFGNGTRLSPENAAKGMGRFGMGLPSASISQCRRVDVWSWQKGASSAMHSYIDLNEIEAGSLKVVPAPQPLAIPDTWLDAKSGEGFGESGTLVVWSQIDRALWRTSKALIDNSEELIGRMYREWIHRGDVAIRLRSFLEYDPRKPVIDKTAKPNDPLYLMTRTTCPAPFDDKPMFQPFPSEEAYEIRTTIRFQGEDHEVVTRLAIASEAARSGDNAGSKPHGRHAARNVGVSVVRAGRELELDPAWTTAYDPRERWWGVEVRFEPGLDELFGVSNNKQSARNFAEAAKIDTAALIKEHGGSISRARQALADEEDPLEPLLELVHRIQTNIREMRKLIGVQAEGRRRKRHQDKSVEVQATEAVRKRQEAGHRGRSDDDEQRPLEERASELAEQLEASGHSPEAAQALAAETIDKGLKYRMDVASLEGGAFFSVQPRGGVLLVTLNTDHPAYELLLGAQDPASLPGDPEALKEKLQAAQSGLEMMLFAWARYEDEQTSVEQRRSAQNVRHDWGRMAEGFLGAQ